MGYKSIDVKRLAGALGAIAVQFVAPDSFTFLLSVSLLVGLAATGVGLGYAAAARTVKVGNAAQLKDLLVGSNEWLTSADSQASAWTYLDGAVSVDEITFPKVGVSGLSLRLFSTATAQSTGNRLERLRSSGVIDRSS